MTNTQAWLIVAALFAFVYTAGVLTVPTIRQITGQWPPMWWTRLRSRTMTHNQRVLELLADGQPHSHHEIYRLFVVGHSRIADLRRQGHQIECWRDDNKYWYRLLNDGHVSRPGDAVPSPDTTDAPVVEQPDGQLVIA